MADERCGICRFRPKEVCRRFPPIADQHWPTVLDGDWCGEWQPRRSPSFSHGRGTVSPAPTRSRALEIARERR